MRTNRTQAALDNSAAVRAFKAETALLDIRDRIRPLFARKVASLAAMVQASPIRTPARRAQRDRITA